MKPAAVRTSSPSYRANAWSRSSGIGCHSGSPALRAHRHCLRWRSKSETSTSKSRSRRYSRTATLSSGLVASRLYISMWSISSAAPSNPGCPAPAAVGYSENVPTTFAKSFRNSPSAGSSGITTMRIGTVGRPAAFESSSTTRAPAGCCAAIWSFTRLSTKVSCRSSGRMFEGSLSMLRNV